MKKIDTFKNSVSFAIVKEFYGDNSFNLIKNMREVNDHDISAHLDVLNSIREEDILKDLYDIYGTADDGEKIQVKLDKDKMEKINDRLHRATYNKMNLKLKDIKKHVKSLAELSKEVIELLESSIKIKQKITINHKHFFVWNVNKTKMKKH